MVRCKLAFGEDRVSVARAAAVERALEDLFPQLTIVGFPMSVQGGESSLFERLVVALDTQEADAAVVDGLGLPRDLPTGIREAAVMRRADPRYRLLTRSAADLATIPSGQVVACSDAVGRAQIRHRRPDLAVAIPANGPLTIVEGIRSGAWAAAVLPPEIVESASPWGLRIRPLDEELILPSAGRGLTVVLVRAGASACERQIEALGDATGSGLLAAERAFVRTLASRRGVVGGALAKVVEAGIRVAGIAVDPDGAWLCRDEAEAEARWAEVVAVEVAESVLEMIQAAAAAPREPLRRASNL